MSRNWVPALVAIGVGVFSGYYSFQPSLKELQSEKLNPRRAHPGEQTRTPNDLKTPTSLNTNDSTGAAAKSDIGSTPGGNSKQ